MPDYFTPAIDTDHGRYGCTIALALFIAFAVALVAVALCLLGEG